DGVCSGPGTCAVGANSCTTSPPANISCNGTGACSCNQTVSGASFCSGNDNSCTACNVDADCGTPGWKCVVIGGDISHCNTTPPLRRAARVPAGVGPPRRHSR